MSKSYPKRRTLAILRGDPDALHIDDLAPSTPAAGMDPTANTYARGHRVHLPTLVVVPYRVLTPRVLIWLAILITIDVLLFFVALRRGVLQHGTAPLLDLWDLVKAGAIAALLLSASRRARSTGLAVFGGTFLAIEILDGTRAHALLAGRLFDLIPLDSVLGVRWVIATGLAELLVMLAIGAAMLGVILAVPDHWRPFPHVRIRLTVFLVGLIFFAGFVDLYGSLSGDGRWAIVEEAGERLVFSITLAYSALVLRLARRTAGDAEPAGALRH